MPHDGPRHGQVRITPERMPTLARERRRALLPILLILAVSAVSVAAGAPEKKSFWPSGAAWSRAARNGLRHPGTWVPAGAAAVIAIGGWDQEISDWAVENTPVFGSVENAATWSDRLRAASDLGMIGTALGVHADEHPWRLRGKTLLVEEVGAIVSTSVTALLKSATDRERPDGSDEQSFPSGHATRAFAYVAASWRNLRATRLGPRWQLGIGAGLETLAAGTAWARVEAQAHFPTDVLIGAAVGNYVALLFHDAFLGAPENVAISVDVDPDHPSLTVALRF